MPDITSDDIHEHLIRKISNQAAQLGLLNNDLCDAAEYIKTCESKLIEFENAAFASSKQIEIYERTNRSNEDVISKLQQNLTSKEGQLASHRKEIADLSKEIQKLRVQLKTAQHSLRFASQTPSSTDNGSQSKSRSEVILLKANLKLYKEQAESAKSSEQSMKSKVLTLEKILEDHSIYSGNSSRGERLNDQHDMISSTALASGRGAILSNPAGVQLNNRSDRGTASSESAVRDSGIIERRSMTAVEQLIKSSQIEAFEAQRELSTMQLNELSRQLKAVEEERDTLLQYIQTDLVDSSSLRAQLDKCQLELTSSSAASHESEERAVLMLSKYEEERVRADGVAAELSESRSLLTNMAEQYRSENIEKSSEAKKGAYIISILTSELKAARAKVCELEASAAESDKQLLADAESAKASEQSRKHSTGSSQSSDLLRKSDPSRQSDRALAELVADLKALSGQFTRSGSVQRQRSISFAAHKTVIPLKSALSSQHGRRNPASKDGKWHSDRSTHRGRDESPAASAAASASASASVSATSTPGYMRSRSPGSRSPSRAKQSGPSVPSEGSYSCPLTEEHTCWTDLPSLHRAVPELGAFVTKIASDLNFIESQHEDLLKSHGALREKYDSSVAASNAQIFSLTVANKTLHSETCDMRAKLDEAETGLEQELGSSNILDQTVIALLDAPGGWEKFLDDRLLNSLLAEASSIGISKQIIGMSGAPSEHSDGSSSDKTSMTIDEMRGSARGRGSDESALRSDSRSPSPRTALDRLKSSIVPHQPDKKYAGPLWTRGVGSAPAAFRDKVPEVVHRVVAVAGLALTRACQAEGLLVTALSDLKTHQSAFRISKGQFEYMSKKYEESRLISRNMGDSFLELETNLKNDLRAATDLAERQNTLIAASDAKVQVLVREKHLLNARLTAACQVESMRSEGGKTHVPLSDRTLDQNMVLEFTPIPTGHSTAPQSQRYQSTSAGHGTQTQTHPSMHREGARLFSRAQGQLSESHDRSATEDVPSILPNKIGQQSSAETRPNRSDPQHESRAQEDRWSVRQSVSQRTCPPPSSSFCSYGDESMADFNVSARESFASDSISRTRGQRDIDRDGPVQERAMTSSEFVKYVKARRKVNQ